MTDLLPPGLGQEAFDEALDGFRAAVGPEWVFDQRAERASYLDPFAMGDQAENACAAAVAPGSTDELRLCLEVANRFRIPVWPVSMGKNFAYGTAAPHLRGSVVLDLKRMNRIISIDERLGTAVVEPGVSFFDFKAELDRRGSGLWMSGPAHSWGSVIGNALEHGVGYTPYGIHAETICGMEVMLADGTLVRTGMGATGEAGQEWQCYKWPFGPSWDGAFTQSNFGIVTKMGLWLMPEPDGMAGVTIDVPAKGDLAALIEALRPLRINDTINATYTIANGWRQITGGRQRRDVHTGPGAVPEERVRQILAESGRGWWNVIFNLFDRPAGLDLRLEAIGQALSSVPGATMRVERWRKGEAKQPWMRQDVSLAPLGLVDWHGSPGGHCDFGPVIAPVGERVEQVYNHIEQRFIEYGVDPWIGMFGLGGRALVMVADLIYLRNDAEMTDRCRRLFRQLCEDMAEIGIGLYRSHITFMEDVVDMHRWGDGALPAFNDRIKRALDPNGILAPGKQGIGSWS